MAIRKFRKNMKPVIWVVTILFLGTLVAGYVFSFRGSSAQPQVAFKLNGNKVTHMEVQRTMATMAENYNRYLGVQVDPDTINTIGFNEAINKELTLEMAKELKIKVSSSEVKDQLDKIKSNFENTEQFKQAIFAQGYTTATLEQEIKENLLIQKTIAEIENNVKITPEDVQKFYDNNKYTMFDGQPLDKVNTQIEKTLRDERGYLEYSLELAKARAEMKLDDVADNYSNYVEKNFMNIDGQEISNLDFSKRVLGGLVATKGDLEKAKENAEKSLNEEIALLNKAVANGVVVNKILPLDLEVNESLKGLYEKLKSEVKYTDNDLKKFFDENKVNYDVFKSADADIALIKINPSEEDDLAAKIKAEDLLKKVTPENFAEMAKENSDGPSGPTGGSLGTFGKGTMVKPFEDAVFAGKAGMVYPEVVKTQFGYHLIYVQAKDDKNEKITASHILIIPQPSEKTLASEKSEINGIVSDLSNGTITFSDLKKDKNVIFSEDIKDINENGYIPGLGYNDQLTNAIFNAEIGKVNSLEEAKDYVIYRKNSEVEAKEAVYDEVKDRVVNDYINTVAQEEFKNIQMSVQKNDNQ